MARILPRLLLMIVALLGPCAIAAPNFEDQIARPLRYRPDGQSFVIENGTEFFNRPLYGFASAFRIDASDRPEFSLYLPGRGGNLRFGIRTAAGAKWLIDADTIIARYENAAMRYTIRDGLLGSSQLELISAGIPSIEGFILRAELSRGSADCQLICAYGGVTGARARRDGDIGTEPVPISQYFQLKPEYCQGNTVEITPSGFLLHSNRADIAGIISDGATCSTADARHWASISDLLSSTNKSTDQPLAIASLKLETLQPSYVALQRLQKTGATTTTSRTFKPRDLAALFNESQQHGQRIARQIVIDTPDPYINAATAALCIAADGIWDESQKAFMHGAVAWRTKLLGWRGVYSGDALGWHARTRDHLMNFFDRQNIEPVGPLLAGEPARVPQDQSVRLARNEPALHSNGDLTHSHYDMNLVAIDALFRHLLWTGDLDFAREVWPVIERHLAWERRLFRRPFGKTASDMLPLYEAYCCIWASDDLQYNGGGVAHASAYNFFHNTMAARVAKLIGNDPAPYEREAELIAKAMRRELWLSDRGCFAEYRDLLGLQLAHPNAGLWTFYHTVDSQVPTAMEAWQMSRFVDEQIPRIPIRGEGVPQGEWFTLPTTTWMPYTWSTNNVVMAEAAHTALAYWQSGRPDQAFRLYKGCILDSMYQGICPGNVGMCTKFDMARGEAQRDFADGVGATSRALVEGLFGVRPDALAGQVTIQPGFPAAWNHARIGHPDFTFAFERRELWIERYTIEPRFAKPMKVRLVIPALADTVAGLTVDDRPAKWQAVEGSVGIPRIQVELEAGARHEVVVKWSGKPPMVSPPDEARPDRSGFVKVVQGQMMWWLRKNVLNRDDSETLYPMTDWTMATKIQGNFECIDLSSILNDRVTQLFKNEYLSPRSPYCSLAIPTQGIGSWVHWDPAKDRQASAEIDDTGLRTAADKSNGRFIIPQGIPFQTPGTRDGAATAKNIAFTSRWDNYPPQVSVPLQGRASHLYLLMAGSTNSMQSRFDNGEVIVTYTDGSTERLALSNPTTWWPIEQDYQIDDFAFRRPEPIPLRVDLKTGKVRVLDAKTFKGKGGRIDGGAATVLDLPLHPQRELKSLTVRTLANEVVIGLMAATVLTEPQISPRREDSSR